MQNSGFARVSIMFRGGVSTGDGGSVLSPVPHNSLIDVTSLRGKSENTVYFKL